MIRAINIKPDKFLIQCIEMDIYDLLYKADVNNWITRKLDDEVSRMLNNYIKGGLIVRFSDLHSNAGNHASVSVKVYIPKPVVIKCSV